MRIRTVKPEFWTHPVMARLPDFIKLLAIGLLNYADDHGYFIAEPAIIRGALFPMREDSREIREGLAKLSELGYIECHEHPTHGPIGFLPKWKKHQKVDHPKASIYADLWQFAKSAREPREIFAPDLGNKGTREQGSREQGIEGTRDGENLTPSYANIEPEILEPLKGLTVYLMGENHKKNQHYKQTSLMLVSWPSEFYELMEQRAMPLQYLVAILKWSQMDEFWKGVIQSPADLSKNLDKIIPQMKRAQRGIIAANSSMPAVAGQGAEVVANGI